MERKINIYYDVRMIGNSGIGTQIQNVLKQIVGHERVNLTLLGDPAALKKWISDFQGRIIPWRAPIYSIKEQLSFPRPPRDTIILAPHYNAPLRHMSKTVVILHDLIHLHSLEFEMPHYRLYTLFMLSRIAARARRIITVSDYSREDFTARFPLAENKTITNYNGLNHDIFRPPTKKKIAEFRKKYSLPRVFILSVGIAKKHKNLDFVIQSLMPKWQDGSLKIPLIIGGTNGRLPEYVEKKFGNRKSMDFIRVLPRLAGEEMPLLYAAAHLLVMPSLLEGFGFPVIESMACGTPVLCSGVTSLPEVGGDAAVYFDPQNPLDFLDRFFELLNNERRREMLIQRGFRQAEKFDWKTHSSRLLNVLQEALREM